MNYNELGYFQFDNLVQNRVPFLLVNLGVDLSKTFNSVSTMHIENNMLNTTKENALAEVAAKNLTAHYAVVSICKNGKDSAEIAAALDAKGILNAYFVAGGLEGFLRDRSAHR